MWYGILNSTYYFGNSKSVMTPLLFEENLNCWSESESVSAVTDSTKWISCGIVRQ